MTKLQLEAKRDEVIGIIPIYTDRGNNTLILLRSGEIIDENRTIKAVRANLARTYAIDTKAQGKFIRRVLNREGPIPFYIGQRIFIHLKMRKPLTKGDAVYGFIDMNYIKLIEPLKADLRCRLLLTTGQTYKIYSSYSTAIKSKECGQRLLDHLAAEGGRIDGPDEEVIASLISLINCFNEINNRLRSIESKIAEPPAIYEKPHSRST